MPTTSMKFSAVTGTQKLPPWLALALPIDRVRSGPPGPPPLTVTLAFCGLSPTLTKSPVNISMPGVGAPAKNTMLLPPALARS